MGTGTITHRGRSTASRAAGTKTSSGLRWSGLLNPVVREISLRGPPGALGARRQPRGRGDQYGNGPS